MFKKLIAVGMAMLALVTNRPVVAAALANTGTLAGKTALIVGDSIAAGWRDTGYGHDNYTSGGGWSLRLQKEYYMQVSPAAQPGQSLTVIESRGHIIDQLHNNKNGSYDFVILQGGFNDCMGENTPGNDNMQAIPKLGIVSDSFKVEDFDKSTFSGAFEELLYYATTYFPKARIGFIVTYQTPLSAYGGITNGVRKTLEGYTQGDYFKRQMELCDKWGIPYLNLWDGKAQDGKKYSGDILDVDANGVHFPGGSDNIHLNTAGYNAVTPHIALWMADLEPYAGIQNVETTTTKKVATTTTTTKKATTTTTKKATTTTTVKATKTNPSNATVLGPTATGATVQTGGTDSETAPTGTQMNAAPENTQNEQTVSTAPHTQEQAEEDKDTALSTGSSSHKLYVIIGCIAGAVALAVIAAVVLVILRQRNKAS